MLRATATANYDEAVHLNTFAHQLAKVRVVLIGNYNTTDIVQLKGNTTLTLSQGSITAGSTAEKGEWITMHPATYTDIGTCWEANVQPGTVSEFRVNNDACTLDSPITTTAGQITTVVIKKAKKIDISSLTSDNYFITDNGAYHISGSHDTYRRIIIKGEGITPDIYLDNVDYSFTEHSDHASLIQITGKASPTIHVIGENNVGYKYFSGNMIGAASAGIYVEAGSTLTIKGDGKDTFTDGDKNSETGNVTAPTLVLIPQQVASFTLSVNYGGTDFQTTISPEGGSVNAATRYTYTISVGRVGMEVSNVSITPWTDNTSGTGNITIL